MEKSLFIVLAVFLMASGVSGGSQSMACSMVNGQWICDKQTSSGNAAMSSSSANVGSQGSSQNTYAGAGNLGGNWQSTGQRVTTGNGGFTANNDYFEFDDADFKGDSGGSDGPFDEGTCYTSSSSSPSPNIATYANPMTTVGLFGFASAGNFHSPMFTSTFVSGFTSIPQDSSKPNGGSSNGGMAFSSSSSGSAPNFGTNIGPVTSGGGIGGFPNGGMSFSSSSSSGSAPNFGTNMGPMTSVGGFAGGSPGGGMTVVSSSSGSAPNFGPSSSAGGYGFATAGNAMPYFPPGFPFNFVPGFYNPPQYPPPSSGADNADTGNSGGSYAGASNAGGSYAGASNAGGSYAGASNAGGSYTGASNAGSGFAGPGAFAGAFAGAGTGNFGPGNFDPVAFVMNRG